MVQLTVHLAARPLGLPSLWPRHLLHTLAALWPPKVLHRWLPRYQSHSRRRGRLGQTVGMPMKAAT